LAEAEEQQVLALWSGLGYYNRARYLHRTAQICVADHAGQMPQSLDGLVALPGIGRSTAAAILSLAYGQPEPIMDGNVKRVFARHFLVAGEPNQSQTLKQFWSLADAHKELDDPAAYTQGLMDLGATLCTKHRPQCGRCPVQATCQAHAQDCVAAYPAKKKRVKQQTIELHGALIERDGRLLLQQRRADGIWPNLWFLPTHNQVSAIQSQDPDARLLFSLTHKLTHRIVHIHVYRVAQSESNSGLTWVHRNELHNWPHPKALNHLLEQHDNH
jgi:A/G-specific adenine glycosylase